MATKPLATAIIGFLLFTPGYALYAGTAERQSNFQAASTMNTGETLVNSGVALDRARFCQLLTEGNGTRFANTLIGGSFQVDFDAEPGAATGALVCALDSSTAEVVQVGYQARYKDVAIAKESDLQKFHDRLIGRGLVTQEQINQMTTEAK